jgi:hypothetical protein
MVLAFDPLNPSTWQEQLEVEDVVRQVYEHWFHRIWAENNLRNEKGDRLSFEGRPGMQDVWDDIHTRTVVQKPSQIGASTLFYMRALHAAAVQGKTCIYTMPTDGDASKLVTGRIDRVIDHSPLLRTMTGRDGLPGRRKPIDNTEQKHLGKGIIYFDGTKGESGALSIPADQLYHDELDFSDPETIEMYRRRLNAVPAEKRVVHQFSTPTVDGVGINAAYEDSTAAQWLVKCGCGWEGTLDYLEHTDAHLEYLRCTECGRTLDPNNGRWVEQHPGADVHGYHFHRLMFAMPGDTEFLRALHQERERSIYTWHFDNMELGVTSKEGTASIDVEAVKRVAFTVPYAQQIGAEPGTGPYYMGIDQGDTLTIGVGRADFRHEPERIRLVHFERVRDKLKPGDAWDRAEQLMTMFRIELCIVDMRPEGSRARALARKFPGRVLCAVYVDGQLTEVITAADVEKRAAGDVRGALDSTEHSEIKIERTESLDNTSTALQSGVFMLPSPAQDLKMQEFLHQLSNNIRKPILAANGTPTYRWERRRGPNDYFHMCNYLRKAWEEGMRLRRQGRSGGSPLTVAGARPKRA